MQKVRLNEDTTPAETKSQQIDAMEGGSPTSPDKKVFILPEDDSPSKATSAETPTVFSSKILQPMELNVDHTQLKANLLWLHCYAFTMGLGVF